MTDQESPTAMDFLSYSPSLVEILQFMRKEDILKCKLVNSRMGDVMDSNWTTLKPTAWTIKITCKEKNELMDEYALVEVMPRDKMTYCAYVTEKMVLLALSDQKKGIEYAGIDMVETCECEYPSDSLESRLFKRFSLKGYRLFKNNSIEEGLQHVLTPFARRYHLKKMLLFLNPPDSWLKVIADTFYHNRSICHYLQSAMSPMVPYLVESLGCSDISLGPEEASCWIKSFKKINKWNRKIRLVLMCRDIGIVKCLKAWQEGHFSMNMASICWRIPTYEDLENLLPAMENAELQKGAPDEGGGVSNISLKRLIDDNTIRLSITERTVNRIVEIKEHSA